MSENHIEQIVRGIKITLRNLPFITTDRNKNNFDDKNVDESINWIKLFILTFYYFNSLLSQQKTIRK